MNFASYAGNPRVVETLRRMATNQDFPASLLFTGPQGVGKFTLAALVARTVQCREQGEEPCGECKPCRNLTALDDLSALREAALAERGNANPDAHPLILRPHPDVTVLVPDGAFIRVSQMRYVVRNAYTVPSEGSRMFFLIDEAEKLRGDMADVLLKVLEEPPPKTTLILVTHEPFRLRATVRSRCIPFHFAPLTRDEIVARLKKHRPEWKKADRELAAAATQGSLGRALALDLEEYRQARLAALEVLKTSALRRMNPERLFSATAELAGKSKASKNASTSEMTGAERFDFILKVLYSLVNDVLYLQSGQPQESLRNPDCVQELREIATGSKMSWVEETTGQIDRMAGSRRQNVNRQLQLDAMALRSAEVSLWG